MRSRSRLLVYLFLISENIARVIKSPLRVIELFSLRLFLVNFLCKVQSHLLLLGLPKILVEKLVVMNTTIMWVDCLIQFLFWNHLRLIQPS